VVQDGRYTVAAAASSRDIRLSAPVAVAGDTIRLDLTPDSSIGELMADPVAASILAPFMQAGRRASDSTADDVLGIDTAQAAAGIPVGRIRSMTGGQGFTPAQLHQLLATANGAPTDGDHPGQGL